MPEDLCDQNQIYPEIEIHSVTSLNRIYEKLDSSNDAGKRYVLDHMAFYIVFEATFSSFLGTVHGFSHGFEAMLDRFGLETLAFRVEKGLGGHRADVERGDLREDGRAGCAHAARPLEQPPKGSVTPMSPSFFAPGSHVTPYFA